MAGQRHIAFHSRYPLIGILCRIQDTEAKYYADGEDAYDMRKVFNGKNITPEVKNPAKLPNEGELSSQKGTGKSEQAREKGTKGSAKKA